MLNHSPRTKLSILFNVNCTIGHSLGWEDDRDLIPFRIARRQSHMEWIILFRHAVEVDIGGNFNFAFERRRINIEDLNNLTNPI